MTTTKRNKFPSYCLRCEKSVGAYHGVLVKQSGPWGKWACRCSAVKASVVVEVPVELSPAEIAARLAECPF